MGIDFGIFKDLPPERKAQELQKLIDNLKKEKNILEQNFSLIGSGMTSFFKE